MSQLQPPDYFFTWSKNYQNRVEIAVAFRLEKKQKKTFMKVAEVLISHATVIATS